MFVPILHFSKIQFWLFKKFLKNCPFSKIVTKCVLKHFKLPEGIPANFKLKNIRLIRWISDGKWIPNKQAYFGFYFDPKSTLYQKIKGGGDVANWTKNFGKHCRTRWNFGLSKFVKYNLVYMHKLNMF